MTPPVASEEALQREVRTQWPLLTYHYGLSFAELAKMPRWARRMYYDALPSILAKEQMARVEASTYPHMKKDAQRQTIRRLERIAGVHKRQPSIKPRSIQNMQELGAAIGIGVTVVDKDGKEVTPGA